MWQPNGCPWTLSYETFYRDGRTPQIKLEANVYSTLTLVMQTGNFHIETVHVKPNEQY